MLPYSLAPSEKNSYQNLHVNMHFRVSTEVVPLGKSVLVYPLSKFYSKTLRNQPFDHDRVT